MQNVVAALTMVRDDLFFLRHWLKHYGTVLGRENCFVINHGRGSAVAEMAAGCNVIGIPGDPHPNFDMKRWRLLNNMVNGLRPYYAHVIVGDVDELVVVDPAVGGDLLGYLADQPTRRILTPIGLEVLHRPDIEDRPIAEHILGPRRFVRVNSEYSKPCVISRQVKLSRGGHFADAPELHVPTDLYLMHLKYCDFSNFVRVSDHRNEIAEELGVAVREASIGRHWFAEARGDDKALFDGFSQLDLQPEFDLAAVRKSMYATWGPRGNGGARWHFKRQKPNKMYRLPDRFVGAI